MALIDAGQATLDGPLPEAPPFGLVAQAPVVPEADTHWMLGADVYPYTPDLPRVYAACATGTDRAKTPPSEVEVPRFAAFTVYLNLFCTAAGIGSIEEFQRRVTQAFGGVESFAVEHEFATGESEPLSPHLADSNVEDLGGGPVSPAEGLALLEEAIGATGRRGVIHATPGTVSVWDLRVIEDARKLRTKNGNMVVAGGGYIDVVPDGEGTLTGDQQWAWATGPVQVRRSDVFIPAADLAQALDREFNDVTVYAERTYLVDWDTQLQAAVLVDRSLS